MSNADLSNCPLSVRYTYLEDAARLSLRIVHAQEEEKYSLVEIPPELMDLYFNALIHLYNAKSIDARDSVVTTYNIHAAPYPETHSIVMSIDSSKTWAQLWYNGQQWTGNPEISELMQKYDLQLEECYDWINSYIAVLFSTIPINILAISELFSEVEGVYYAEPNSSMPASKDIEACINEGYLELVFSNGYGDCESGCIYKHFWHFKIKYNGEVNYVKSSGDPAPLIELVY